MTLEQIQEKLRAKTVGIAGCGGLGSNCAAALVRAGLGRLVIADFDVVESGNLNRQFYFADQVGMLKVAALKLNLERINPAIQIQPFVARLCYNDIAEVFGDCDVIVEAFDRAEAKQMILEAIHALMPGKPLVMGVGMAGWGDNNLLKTWKSGNLVICGDQQNEIAEHCPPIAPRVGVVANMQANAVLEILLGTNEFQIHNEI
jgi:sulfur carrier protein ThiS adenylyltransferase